MSMLANLTQSKLRDAMITQLELIIGNFEAKL